MITNENLFRNPLLALSTSLIVLSTLFPTLSSATTGKPKVPKPDCRIEIDNAHISTSILIHRQIRFVKVNARSICNVPQQRVMLTVEIHKTGTLVDHLVTSHFTSPTSPKSSGLRVDNLETAKICVSNQLTGYYGIGYSKALIQGKWQYAGRTSSPKIVPLRCGTITQ